MSRVGSSFVPLTMTWKLDPAEPETNRQLILLAMLMTVLLTAAAFFGLSHQLLDKERAPSGRDSTSLALVEIEETFELDDCLSVNWYRHAVASADMEEEKQAGNQLQLLLEPALVIGKWRNEDVVDLKSSLLHGTWLVAFSARTEQASWVSGVLESMEARGQSASLAGLALVISSSLQTSSGSSDGKSYEGASARWPTFRVGDGDLEGAVARMKMPLESDLVFAIFVNGRIAWSGVLQDLSSDECSQKSLEFSAVQALKALEVGSADRLRSLEETAPENGRAESTIREIGNERRGPPAFASRYPNLRRSKELDGSLGSRELACDLQYGTQKVGQLLGDVVHTVHARTPSASGDIREQCR